MASTQPVYPQNVIVPEEVIEAVIAEAAEKTAEAERKAAETKPETNWWDEPKPAPHPLPSFNGYPFTSTSAWSAPSRGSGLPDTFYDDDEYSAFTVKRWQDRLRVPPVEALQRRLTDLQYMLNELTMRHNKLDDAAAKRIGKIDKDINDLTRDMFDIEGEHASILISMLRRLEALDGVHEPRINELIRQQTPAPATEPVPAPIPVHAPITVPLPAPIQVPAPITVPVPAPIQVPTPVADPPVRENPYTSWLTGKKWQF